jgi:hypothetical protein
MAGERIIRVSAALLSAEGPAAMVSHLERLSAFYNPKPVFRYITMADSLQKQRNVFSLQVLPIEPKDFELKITIPKTTLFRVCEVINALNPNCRIVEVLSSGYYGDDFLYQCESHVLTFNEAHRKLKRR